MPNLKRYNIYWTNQPFIATMHNISENETFNFELFNFQLPPKAAWNRYMYVGGNPIVGKDPSGNQAVEAIGSMKELNDAAQLAKQNNQRQILSILKNKKLSNSEKFRKIKMIQDNMKKILRKLAKGAKKMPGTSANPSIISATGTAMSAEKEMADVGKKIIKRELFQGVKKIATEAYRGFQEKSKGKHKDISPEEKREKDKRFFEGGKSKKERKERKEFKNFLKRFQMVKE